MAGVIQRFEQRLEGVVTGAFARAFRSAVQPVEVAAAHWTGPVSGWLDRTELVRFEPVTVLHSASLRPFG